MGSYITRFLSFLGRKDPRTPVKGIGPRIKNIALNNYRGLVGLIVPLALLTWQGKKGEHYLTVQCMWIWMFWFFLIHPVNVPVTALIPIFLLPMAGVMSTAETCQCYMNENIVLFLLTGMLILLLNNSGVDRRIALWIICSGDSCQFSGKRLVFKLSTAAFFLSIFSSRLIVSSTLTQFVTPALMDLQSSTSRYRETEPCYDEMRYIINMAIQTASCIGSIAVPHSSLAILAFRAIFYEASPKGTEYPDIFNYFQYTVYAFPVAFLTFILNFSFLMFMINVFVKKPMSGGSMSQLRNALLKHKNDLPKKVTLHEKISVLFVIFYMLMFFFRWSKYLNKGWGDFRKEASSPEIPGVKDATVAALFVIALHTLPKGFGFTKFLGAEKKSQLPPIKPESGILFWRFVDKNLNYGYIFLIGSGVALNTAVRESTLGVYLAANIGKKIWDHPFNGSVFLVCFISVVLANVMTGVAACAIWLPFIMNMTPLAAAAPEAIALQDEGGAAAGDNPWKDKLYLGALGVGVGSTFGFICPFLYTPAYFCHYTGKVPKLKMLKYGVGCAIVCLIVLWASLVLWAPFLWDPKNAGITWEVAPEKAGATTPPPGDAGF